MISAPGGLDTDLDQKGGLAAGWITGTLLFSPPDSAQRRVIDGFRELLTR
jgi:hypothetical protein